MIVRIWRGWTRPENARAYEEYVLEAIFPVMREIDGCLGVELARRDEGGEVGYVAITRFASLEAVKRFAGDDWERAVVEQRGRELLSRFDEHSAHFDVVDGGS